MSRPPLLAADAVTHTLADGRPLLHDLSFSLADERVGLVGPNGSGKSTLLRLLAGEFAPARGVVRRPARLGYLPQGGARTAGPTVAHLLGIADRLGALERTLDGRGSAADLGLVADAWDLPERAVRVLGELGLGQLPLSRAATAVSGGEATRLALGALLLADPEVLLLDEPTNDLDAASRAALLDVLGAWPRGLVVASHDRALLRRVDRIVALEGGTARSFGGAYDAYREARAQDLAAAERERDSAEAALRRTRRHLQEVRERKERRDARGRRSRGTGSQPKNVLNGRRERSEATGARLEETAERVVAAAEQRFTEARARLEARQPIRMTLPASGLPAGTRVLALRDAAVAPPGGPAILEGLALTIVGPERVAVTGPNGAGKTTLLRAIAGLAPLAAGECRRGVPVTRVAYLDQHAELLGDAGPVLDAYLSRHPRATREDAHAALAAFGFRNEAALRPVAALSGGERMRAALACVLAGPEPPRCLVLDEPTNHLDLESLEQLEAALRGYDGALVVASHDTTFLDGIGVTRALELPGPSPDAARVVAERHGVPVAGLPAASRSGIQASRRDAQADDAPLT